ncbi:MAG: hypothetical protein Q7T81_08350 [Pseudolabrys sp.]|nr:hypothetical protein [Pseudolabrys sp.]
MNIALAPFVLLATLSIAQAASPLDELIPPKADTSACFTRVYDAAHLRKNPKQTTMSMAVRFSYDKPEGTPPILGLGVGLGLIRKGDALPWFAQGGCRWIREVNVDTSGRPLVKEFRKDTGGGCMMAAIPDVFDTLSAEEGGYLIVDRGKDADTLMVYLQDDLMMVKQASRDKPVMREFGAADRVFMLQRAPAAACDFVQRALSR